MSYAGNSSVGRAHSARRRQGLLRGAAGVIFPALLASCGASGKGGDRSDGPFVFVSIPPQAYFVERIGGPHVAVEVMLESGGSPHGFEPAPRQLARLARADLYFSTGVGFERQLLARLASGFKNLTVVDTCARISLRTIEEHSQHSAAASGSIDRRGGERHVRVDGREGRDPHVWLDPRLVKLQCRAICDALKRADPPRAERYERNFDAFSADLDRLHAEIGTKLAPFRGREFFVFHPAYGYFAEAYGLRQVAIEAGGSGPGSRRLTELIDRMRANGARAIFVQPQASAKQAELIAREIGGAVRPLDPLARDYLANLERMANAIAASLHASGR